ncbi:11285_t:CDS:2 [Acaulospora morrowiae]|uniref:11285_t:CDS:1 n=1 Tax=Acaulospora morrowiae TaxID=94023 RepID=A0A9N9C7W6_9GLOM|nr:11285_t:CDS:2 [Acaulospora morrowiae]
MYNNSENVIRQDVVNESFGKAVISFDTDIHKGANEQSEFMRQCFLDDLTLNNAERSYLLDKLQQNVDEFDISNNENEYQCESCLSWSARSNYCEQCCREFFESNFGRWTSGFEEYDKFIQNSQRTLTSPNKVIEWIPSDKFYDIERKIHECFGLIYVANWIDGPIIKWNNHNKTLERTGNHKVMLITLKDGWNQQVETHWRLQINLFSQFVIPFYGLTKESNSQQLMLVLKYMDTDLRQFLPNNHSILSLKDKLNIVLDIVNNLDELHKEQIALKHLHSDIITLGTEKRWYINHMGLTLAKNDPDIDQEKNNNQGQMDFLGAFLNNTLLLSLHFSRYHTFSNLPKPKGINTDEFNGK